MISGDNPSSPVFVPPISVENRQIATATTLGRLLPWLEGAIYLLFIFFVILLPHSIKGAQHAWRIAFVLWLVALLIQRKRPFGQPLSAPLLAYVGLSAISTVLSSDPYLSWDRMKIVCLVLVGVVFAQNLKRLSQIRILLYLLLLSGFAAAGYTAWQYTYGVGVQVKHIVPGTPLYDAGVHTGDIFTRVNGKSVYDLAQLQRLIAESPSRQPMQIDYLRGYPFEKLHTAVSREQIVTSGYATPNLQFGRGKPFRAQGSLGHYVVFAEMLMQLGCVAWAMLLGSQPGNRWLSAALAVIFLAIVSALVATETRAALGGLALGCFLALLVLTGKGIRIAATAALLVVMICGALWIHHTRGVNWSSSNDTGTQFRVLMWEDGLRLVRQHPWFGVGMETVRYHWLEWNIRGFIQYHVQSHFHSTPLQIAVERGLPTLAAWVWFVVAYLIFLFRLIGKTRTRSRFATTVVAAVLAGFVAFLTTSFAHYNLGEEPLVTSLFFFFGIAIAIDHMLSTPGALDVQ
jgi:O-antigen ligase